MKRKTAPILFLITLLFAALASVQNLHAATITVTSTADSGAGSLRAALASASDGDTIDFSVTGTITLTSGELLVGKSVTISGPGAANLAVNGNAAGRVFNVTSNIVVTISGLTITNGHASGGFPSALGGGIYNDHATLTVGNCTLTGNSASGNGGSIYNGGSSGNAMLTVVNSTLSGNSAPGGGGIFNDAFMGSATLTAVNSTLSGNSASSGGGIYNDGQSGSATLAAVNSTLSGNSAHFGGGIYNDGQSGSAMLTVANSTLSGNSGPLGATFGGGIFNDGAAGSATLTVANSTLSGNSAEGIYNDGTAGSATLEIGSTLLKAGGSGTNLFNDSGTITSLGYNLSSDNGGGLLTATGDQINTDPMLGPLQDNGGPTFTHALLSGSPAIDQGKNISASATDQRGFPRTFDDPAITNATGGDGTDIGAVEVQPTACPHPQGFWKNNPDAWPVNSLTLGSQTYTQSELLTILRTPVGTGPKADASLILADQLIATKLNIANGSDSAPVSSTITDADAVLSLYTGKLPYRVRTNSTNGHRMVNDAATLESFNKGALTAGCGS